MGRTIYENLHRGITTLLKVLDEKDGDFIKTGAHSFSNGKQMIKNIFYNNSPFEADQNSHYPINAIPSEKDEACAEILYVAIGTKDKPEIRLLESIEQLKRCPSIKCVVIHAAKWEVESWLKYKDSFKDTTCILRILGQTPVPELNHGLNIIININSEKKTSINLKALKLSKTPLQIMKKTENTYVGIYNDKQ